MRRSRRSVAGLVLVALVGSTAMVAPAQAAATRYRFQACPRTSAAPTTTNLRPVAAIGTQNGHDPAVGAIPRGRVTVEHVADLSLTDGRLGAGAGFDVVTGGVAPVRVSRTPVVAPVTLVVLNSKQSGRRVAFVEVRVRTARPVRWVPANTLSILTDGGDGGFARGTMAVDESFSDSLIDAYVAAYGKDGSGGVCVLRRAPKGAAIDAVAFYTGYGDGAYPTFVGKDETGAVVSVVSYGGVLPWHDAGLPGRAPKAEYLG